MNWHSLDRSRDWLAKTTGSVSKLGRRSGPVGVFAILVVAVAQMVPACSSGTNATNVGGGQTVKTGTGGADATVAANACDHPSPGCACSQAGQTSPCGKVILRSGDFFQCEEGTTTCDGSTWGACEGMVQVQANAVVGAGLRLQGYGQPTNCGGMNACDPYCQNTSDTPVGIDAGANFGTSDAGLVVAPASSVNFCDLPTNATNVYANRLTGAWDGNVASCTGGQSDNCNYDMQCSAATGGTCAPYTDGALKTTGTCGTQPDFTLGLGCWASNAAPSDELEVCNRGGVTASTGTLLIEMITGAPTLAAGSCGAGAKVPTGTPASAGSCSIPLSQVPIGAGECITVSLSAPTAPITCTAPPAGQDFYAYVNPPTAFDAANTTPVVECDPCNNFTAVNHAEKPTGANTDALCTKSWCGVKAGATSGSPCNTAITGTVMDPGGNVGLSNVAVYIATAAPITIPDEPANGGTLTATPTCDTCASLSTAGYLNGVATNTDGTFTLPLAAGGMYNVIAQLGRWRKVVGSFNAPNCVTTPMPAHALDLPQCRNGNSACAPGVQGDIPKMAIVEGQRESLECWFKKVGVDASEVVAYSAGAPQRIHTYVAETNGTGENIGAGAGTTPPSASTLWDNGTSSTINLYSAVFSACDGQQAAQASGASSTAVVNYANAGGRLFFDHEPGRMYIYLGSNAAPSIASSGWSGANVASWNPGNSNQPSGNPAQGLVENNATSADQQAMYAWLAQWDNFSFGAGYIKSSSPWTDVTSVGAASLELVRGDQNNSWPGNSSPYNLSFWFNTPTTASVPNYCGRVVYNDMHVSSARGGTNSGSSFPASCQTSSLTSEELALEYEMFALSECNLGVTAPTPPPPPPPPPGNLTPQTFTRVFQANCPSSFTVKWGFFEWAATIPSPTSISFSFATGAASTGPWGASVPTPAFVTTTSTAPGTLATTGTAVDTYLTTAVPAQTSQQWLQVSMTLTPAGQVSPALLNWQQLFDCVP